MNQQQLEPFAQEFTGQSPLNRVHLEKGCQDIQMFEAPIFDFASAADPLFDAFQNRRSSGCTF